MADNLGNRLKEIRKSHGFSQKEIAEKLGINQTAYGKYERGDILPSTKRLIDLSKIFNISIGALIGADLLGVSSDFDLNDVREPTEEDMLLNTLELTKGLKEYIKEFEDNGENKDLIDMLIYVMCVFENKDLPDYFEVTPFFISQIMSDLSNILVEYRNKRNKSRHGVTNRQE